MDDNPPTNGDDRNTNQNGGHSLKEQVVDHSQSEIYRNATNSNQECAK